MLRQNLILRFSCLFCHKIIAREIFQLLVNKVMNGTAIYIKGTTENHNARLFLIVVRGSLDVYFRGGFTAIPIVKRGH